MSSLPQSAPGAYTEELSYPEFSGYRRRGLPLGVREGRLGPGMFCVTEDGHALRHTPLSHTQHPPRLGATVNQHLAASLLQALA